MRESQRWLDRYTRDRLSGLVRITGYAAGASYIWFNKPTPCPRENFRSLGRMVEASKPTGDYPSPRRAWSESELFKAYGVNIEDAPSG